MIEYKALTRLDEHWAVSSIGTDALKRAHDIAKTRYAEAEIGKQITLNFEIDEKDIQLVERVAMAYEIAAIEGIDSLLYPSSENEQLREQAQAGAYRSYELRRTLPLPESEDEKLFHVLHLSGTAYCGDRWMDLRRWLQEYAPEAPNPDDSPWDRRVLYRLYDCWLRLLRKNQWEDLDGIPDIIAGLRQDQKQYEKDILDVQDNTVARTRAFRLICLYHWAKASELLALYMLQGEPGGVRAELDKHFEASRKAAQASRDAPLEVVLRWLHIASRQMVSNSLWGVLQHVNSRAPAFVEAATKRAMFELLPPQRAAIQNKNLLDTAMNAVVVELPTSGGKTVLAQFRMLQALNNAVDGWVAYVAPTKALVTQITRRLRKDFSPIGLNVEQLSGAIEIDSFEEKMLTQDKGQSSFHVLVSTPEKLQLVVRNKKVSRPLLLVVMDEAHNIEEDERGLRIELLLATIKREYPRTHFMLLMPFVPNAEDLATWLSPESGKSISFSTSAWQPNERIVGMFWAEEDKSKTAGWQLYYKTLTTSPRTMELEGTHKVGDVRPLETVAFNKVNAKGWTAQAGAMAKVFSERGTSIVVAKQPNHAWSVARTLANNMEPWPQLPEQVALVQRFLKTEVSPEFELIDMLSKGIAVHHSGLSDEAKNLIEWLAEEGLLKVLCATTTIAQGINFPVSSVFLASKMYPLVPGKRKPKEMTRRAFWNLAGRAGRINHDSIGVVGISAGKDPKDIIKYVKDETEELVSRLYTMLDELDRKGDLDNLPKRIHGEQWTDFRCYVAHLWTEKQNLEEVLNNTELLLRNTLGYSSLRSTNDISDHRKAKALLEATKSYAKSLDKQGQYINHADATGFDPEGVRSAMAGLRQLDKKLTPNDWEPDSMFGAAKNSVLPQLVGVMMNIPQLERSFEKIIGSHGIEKKHIASMTTAWVSGNSIDQIAEEFFSDVETHTDRITYAFQAVYGVLANSGPWGLSALSRMGVDFDNVTEEQRRRINNLPAMIYHGVSTEEGILMRMNSVPRTVAEKLGKQMLAKTEKPVTDHSVGSVREFLRSLKDDDWEKVKPKKAPMSGKDYREVWQRLSGEDT